MAEKKRFLLRVEPELWGALEKWAADDLRSINGQIEFLLKDAARRAGRLKERPAADPYRSAPEPDGDAADDR